MRFKLVIALVFAGAALAACSSSTPSTPAESAASTEALPPPEAEARATPEAASQGGDVAPVAPAVPSAEAPSGEADSLPAADSGWAKAGVTPEQHRADIESCYAYAWSQVQRDLNIDSDIDSARFDDDSGLGFNQLTARMDAYDAGNRRISLMNACMEAKGYVRV